MAVRSCIEPHQFSSVPVWCRRARLRRRKSGSQIQEFQMAVPKRKTSPMKRGFRRSADGLTAPTYVEDKDSGELRRPHHIDLKSGKYRGRQILKPQEEI